MVTLALTAEGRRLVHQVLAWRRTVLTRLLQKLDPDEVATATNTLAPNYEFRRGSKDWTEAFEPSELREWQSQLQRGRAAVHLLCAQETRAQADAFVKACWRAKNIDQEDLVRELRAFTASLRKEIGSK
ncbi:hypothetical protein [Saccharopolyspora sp. NPDC050642]|uniref:hypothetical protein n=1 Tax=Saccharopolyspora sp. NPDC050642 TaxID=3157099 RepID=UPI0033E49861